MIFDVVAAAHVNVDTIIQNVVHGMAEMSFSVPAEDVAATRGALERAQAELGAFTVEENHDLGKVSLIGAGMRSHPGVAAKMFRTLADNEINLQMISTSPIKISCMIARSEIPNAVRALHDAFELETEPDRRMTLRPPLAGGDRQRARRRITPRCRSAIDAGADQRRRRPCGRGRRALGARLRLRALRAPPRAQATPPTRHAVARRTPSSSA